MNAATSRTRNLGLNVETRSRAKLVSAAKRAVARLTALGDRVDAIATVNATRPIEKSRAIGYDGDGAAMLHASSTLAAAGQHDAAWHKALSEMDKARAAYLRTILKAEAVLASMPPE